MKEEPRIFIWKGGWKGGVEKLTLGLAEGFKKYHGLNPSLGVFEKRDIDLEQIVVKRIFPKRLAGYNALWGTWYLNRKKILGGYDIAYSRSGLFLKTRNNFYVCHEDGDLDLQIRNLPTLSRMAALPVIRTHIYMMKKADLVISSSREYDAFFRRHGIKEYEVCSPSFADTKVFRPIKASKPSEKFNLLFVGRTGDPRKNFASLREACLKLKEKVNLYVVGSEGKSGGNIHFVGEVSTKELVEWYNRCDLLVMPSFWEGISLTLLESLSCQNPTLISKFAVLKAFEEFVVTFNPYAKKELEQKILWIMENYDQIKRRAVKGRQFVVRNFDKEKVTKKEANLILEAYWEYRDKG